VKTKVEKARVVKIEGGREERKKKKENKREKPKNKRTIELKKIAEE